MNITKTAVMDALFSLFGNNSEQIIRFEMSSFFLVLLKKNVI